MDRKNIYSLLLILCIAFTILNFTSNSESTYYQVDNLTSSYNTSESNNSSEIKFETRLINEDITSSSPAEIQFRTHIKSNNVSLVGKNIYPFGVIYSTSKENRLILWSNQYEEKGLHMKDGNIRTIDSTRVIKTHTAGEVISRNYLIRSKDIPAAGEYTIKEDIGYITENGRENLSYQINFHLRNLKTE